MASGGEEISNWLIAIFAGVQIISDAGFSYLLFRAAGWRAYLKDLKDDLEKSQKQLIDQKLGEFRRDMEGVQRRLTEGDEDFEKLGERDQQSELRFTKSIADLKTWMLQHFAEKSDLRRHEDAVAGRQREMDKSIGALSVQVAGIANERRRDV